MTRAQIRAILRRQINDVGAADGSGVQYENEELNEVIDAAYQLVQKEVRKVDPEAHLSWDYADIVADKTWYDLPETFGLVHVAILDPESNLYVPIKQKRYEDLAAHAVWSGGVLRTAVPPDVTSDLLSQTYYTIRGQFLGLFPQPNQSVEDGLEFVHFPIKALAEDCETPILKSPLHVCIAWWAKLILLGDTSGNSEETRARLNEVLGDIPGWYNQATNASEKLSPEF